MSRPPAGERRGGKRESQSQLRRHDQQPLSLAAKAKHVGGKSRSHQPRSSNAMSLVGHTAAESSESEEGEGMDLAALKAQLKDIMKPMRTWKRRV